MYKKSPIKDGKKSTLITVSEGWTYKQGRLVNPKHELPKFHDTQRSNFITKCFINARLT